MGHIVVVCLFLLAPTLAAAQDYQAQLKEVAVNLVAKLEAANRHSGTVLDFTDLQGAPTELGRFLAQELTDQLVAAGKTVSFVDRANVQYLRRENNLSDEGFINPQTRQKYGNLVGIDTVILGTTTPMGQSIRLNLRAISIETGTIIATQATTLPALGEIGQLYTHGVASEPPATQSMQSAVSTPDSRSRFRADSIRLTGREVVVSSSVNTGTTATFSLENLSGIGFDAAIRSGATSIGPCVGNENRSSGLGLFVDKGGYVMPGYDGEKVFRYVPVNGKIIVSVTRYGYDCSPASFAGSRSTDIALSLIVKIGTERFDIPLSASGVLVRAIP
jgi:hypothetical protein